MSVVVWEDIERKEGSYITVSLLGATPATAANYSHFFIARRPIEILRVSEVHATKGTDAGAVTLQVELLAGTTAPGSGTSVLGSGFDLKGTINTVVTKETTSLTPSRIVKEGNRLALKLTGTPTAVASLVVTIYYKAANRGDYR